jgi:hypothetical protein
MTADYTRGLRFRRPLQTGRQANKDDPDTCTDDATAKRLDPGKVRDWFDIAVVYSNNRRAILAIDKGTSGERVFADAQGLEAARSCPAGAVIPMLNRVSTPGMGRAWGQGRRGARAASGHAAAAPPSSVMNARRFIRSPRRRAPGATAVLRGRAPSRSSD